MWLYGHAQVHCRDQCHHRPAVLDGAVPAFAFPVLRPSLGPVQGPALAGRRFPAPLQTL